MRIVRGRGPSTPQPRSGDVGNDIGEKIHPTTEWILSVDDPLKDYFVVIDGTLPLLCTAGALVLYDVSWGVTHRT